MTGGNADPWARTVFELQHRIWPGWRASEGDAADTAGFLQSWLGLPERACVLDAGCGSGREARAMAAIGWSVVGVDWSFELLRLARGRSADVMVAAADLRRLPFPQGSFDAAVLWDSTLAVLDASGAGAGLTEVVRTVRRGGPVVVEQMGIAAYREPATFTFGPDETTPGTTTRTYSWDSAARDLLDVVDHIDAAGACDHYEQRLRLGTADELATRLARVGLVDVRVEGAEDWSFSAPGHPATDSSKRIAAVGWKR